jgi:crotonobetainyl-CoA:carnitine CoA-transferase CaiB-like acyl-CoA transferase
VPQDSRPAGETPLPSPPTRALEGVVVLDFSHALAGPYCTMLLADYGAEVYKLESPRGGELGRGWGPPFVNGQASFFLGLNRGKRGISIDLKRPEGTELCLQLADRADVLVENFRPGTMDRLGLGYETVHNRNPRLVYCSISGYGQNGPSRDEAAMDLIVECSSGFLSITGTEDGERVRSGYAVADINAGLFAAFGILMALHHRARSGEGQLVDISLFDGMISAMSSNYMTYLGSGQDPRPLGTGFPTVVPYRVFPASDRAFAIAVGSEKLWAAFCQAIGHPELRSHPHYETNAARIQNRKALEETLEAIFRGRSATEWIEALGVVGIPCSLVRTFAEVAEHPQAKFRQMFPWVKHPGAGADTGAYRVTGSPIKMSATPGQPVQGAPLLGEHTSAALSELLGLDANTIAQLAAVGIIAPAPKREGATTVDRPEVDRWTGETKLR